MRQNLTSRKRLIEHLKIDQVIYFLSKENFALGSYLRMIYDWFLASCRYLALWFF